MRTASALAALMTLPALAADPAPAANPFFTEWKTPFGVPPFAEIKEDHFLPAFKEGMARQKTEVALIAEAKAVNQIRHRNIIDIFGFGTLPDGRPYFVMRGEPDHMISAVIGGHYATVINEHFFETLALNSRITLHVICHYGRDPHHITEAEYKAVARALREAVEKDPRVEGVPSTKGAL